MHDSEQDPVAYSTLPFKVLQTTKLVYKLHTDCTVPLQHSSPTWHQETMEKGKDQQHRLLLRIHTPIKMHQASYIANIPCETAECHSNQPLVTLASHKKVAGPSTSDPDHIQHLPTQQHVNITAAAS